MTKSSFTEEEFYVYSTKGLLATLTGLLTIIGVWIKNFFIKRNNNIETRLVTVETKVDSIFTKLTLINHKIDNQDSADAGAFQTVLDRLDDIERNEKGYVMELLKIIDTDKNK